jgi:PQQ-dependent catabolism-associated beta-propeller protein
MAHLIDTLEHKVVGNILVDPRPRHASFSSDGTKLWVSSEIGGTLTIIDVATQSIDKVIKFEIQGVSRDAVQPVGFVFTKDGSKAFVALGPANRVAVIDMKTLGVMQYLLVGQRVWHMAMTPKEDLLFTTNGVSNDVTVIDVKALRPVKSIKVGRYPWGAAVKPKS